MRILITGWPRTGKTTFAKELQARSPAVPCRSTDDFIGMGWDTAIEYVAELLRRPGPWILEGVQLARALRHFHGMFPNEKLPCDRLYVLRTPRVRLTQGQRTMGKGIDTVLGQIAPWIRKSGVQIVGAATVGAVHAVL